MPNMQAQFRTMIDRLVAICHTVLLELGIFAEIRTVRVALGLVFMHMLWCAFERRRRMSQKARPTLHALLLDEVELIPPPTPTGLSRSRSGGSRGSRSPSSSDAGSSAGSEVGRPLPQTLEVQRGVR